MSSDPTSPDHRSSGRTPSGRTPSGHQPPGTPPAFHPALAVDAGVSRRDFLLLLSGATALGALGCSGDATGPELPGITRGGGSSSSSSSSISSSSST